MSAGRIEIILGPMFSGKTSELFRRVRRHAVARRNVVVVKFADDLRYSAEKASTHDNVLHEAVSARLAGDVDYTDADVVGFDEGQFFPDLEFVVRDLLLAGKIVIIAALDGTFEGKPFSQDPIAVGDIPPRRLFTNVLNLIPMASVCFKLMAVCSECGGDAPLTRRLISGTSIKVIGGTESYAARCAGCFVK